MLDLKTIIISDLQDELDYLREEQRTQEEQTDSYNYLLSKLEEHFIRQDLERNVALIDIVKVINLLDDVGLAYDESLECAIKYLEDNFVAASILTDLKQINKG